MCEDLTIKSMSAVVVTFQSESVIAKCLDSVLSQSERLEEVIVVDNASTDQTIKIVETDYPHVRVIRNRSNVGYGAAVNLAIKSTTSPLVAILNPDTVLSGNWVAQTQRAIMSRPACGAVEGKLLLLKEPRILNCRGSCLNILGFGCATGYGEVDRQDEDEHVAAYPSGAAFVIRRAAFDEVKGFDDSYFLYHEDVDLGIRLYTAGWYVLYTPSAVAYHDFKSTLIPEKVRLLEQNRWSTLAKNMPTDYFVRVAPLMIVSELGILVHLSRTGLLSAKARAAAEFVRRLPKTASVRSRSSRVGLREAIARGLLTGDFPQIVPKHFGMVRLGERLTRSYFRAFFEQAQPCFQQGSPRETPLLGGERD